MEMSEVYRFFKAPFKNSIRSGNESRQSYIYEKLVSKTLICKLVFGTSNIIIHGSWESRASPQPPFFEAQDVSEASTED